MSTNANGNIFIFIDSFYVSIHCVKWVKRVFAGCFIFYAVTRIKRIEKWKHSAFTKFTHLKIWKISAIFCWTNNIDHLKWFHWHWLDMTQVKPWGLLQQPSQGWPHSLIFSAWTWFLPNFAGGPSPNVTLYFCSTLY